MSKIQNITARQVLDSRDTPTVEAEVFLEDGSHATAAVPSGASTGSHEAFELRDGDANDYGGKSVHKAVANVHQIILPALKGLEATEQKTIDEIMMALDGTENKSRLGANAILAVSLATARVAAVSQKIELYQHLHNLSSTATSPMHLPFAMFNIINGGVHAPNSSDFQEYMIIPMHEQSFEQRLQCASAVFQSLKQLLLENHQATTVGDEGGFAPQVSSNSQAFDFLVQAISQAGYQPGPDVLLAVDVAASQFYEAGQYHLKKDKQTLSSQQMTELFEQLTAKYPLVSIEDPLEENDFTGFAELTKRLGNKVQIVGDDLYTTNPKRLQTGIEQKSTTAILIKLNQIGTLTETLDVVNLAHQAGLKTIVSHRSGETEDSFEADLAVAVNAEQVKFGSLTRSERLAKYNRLLKIEEQLIN